MDQIFPEFLNNIRKKELIKDIDTVILGFSGGKDSTALLILLNELKKEIKFNLIAAYLNHNIRTDFKEEETYVKNFCRKLKIQLVTENQDVPSISAKNKINLESAASITRYDFLNRVSKNYDRSIIATAHSKSDLTETFIMKLLRGTGSLGLSSIFEQKNSNIIRPLLFFSEEDILSFLDRNRIKYYKDSSNDNTDFLRNRIRKTIIPKLKDIEPKLEDHILITSGILRTENNYFKEKSEIVLKNSIQLNVILPASAVLNEHPAIQNHILREYIRIIKGNLFNITFNHIDAFKRRIVGEGGISLPGIKLMIKKGFIYPLDIEISDYEYFVKGAEKLNIPEIGKSLIFSESDSFKRVADKKSATFSLRDISFPLIIRSPQKEDRYKKINSKFFQPVFEMIKESGLPEELVKLAPLVTDVNGKPLWVAGSHISDEFKISERKKREKLFKVEISELFRI